MTGAPIVRSIVWRVAPDLRAMSLEDLGLVAERIEADGKPVRHVGVLRRDPQGSLLAASANEDRWSLWLDWARHVERLADPVVATLERRAVLGEHRAHDRECLVEPVHPLAKGRKVEAVARVLDVVPGCAEPEDRPATRQDVEGRRGLREQRRVAVRDAGHERAQPDAARFAGERGKDRPALEHRIGNGTDALDLVQVIHDRDEAEARLFGGLRLLDDPVEQALVRCVGERVQRKMQAEPGFHVGPPG